MSIAGDSLSDGDLPPVRDMGAWPGSKLARAQTHLGELHSRINAWQAARPYTTVVEIADNRLSWRLRLSVRQQPPTIEWSTIAGDCIHNLRSALDAAVWEFATLNGATPPNPRSLAFPVLADQTKWDKAVEQQLDGVPEEYVARIESIQPFNHNAQGTSALTLLHTLDIDDKHRAGVIAHAIPTTATHHGTVKFGSDEEAARNTPPEITVTPHELTDGAVLIEQVVTDPIERVLGGFRVEMALRLATPDGLAGLLETLGLMNQATVNTLTILYGGGESA